MKTQYIQLCGKYGVRFILVEISGRFFTFNDKNFLGRLYKYGDVFACRWRRFKIAINPLPVYYILDSRDCDHTHSSSVNRASSGRQFLRERDLNYANAEGPTFYEIISKDEYKYLIEEV